MLIADWRQDCNGKQFKGNIMGLMPRIFWVILAATLAAWLGHEPLDGSKDRRDGRWPPPAGYAVHRVFL